MRSLSTVALMATTITVGLMAGLFTSYAYSVMPALANADDRTFVDTMQRINVAILNGWFMVSFMGAVIFGLAAVLLHLRSDLRAALPWVIAGVVLYGVCFVVTMAFNVPLNNMLDAAGPVDSVTDLASLRASFESKWVAGNTIRAITSTAGFISLAWALVVHSRA